MEREETEEKESVRKTEKERHEMKYKAGDKVKVRSNLKTSVLYDGLCAIDEMIKKKIVTITSVYDGYYKVVEDDYMWTDRMLEGLVEDELTAEEAIKILAEMCSVPCGKCPISKEKGVFDCRTFRAEYPDKVLEILKQRKKEHEKKEVETEFTWCVLIIEADTHTLKHEEKVGTDFKSIDAKKAEILKKYCSEHDGKYYAISERRCVVKE
jgi:hypothetical protein